MENSEENGGEEEGLVRSCYRLVIVKRVFTMFTSGAEKREIFRPGRSNFRPLHNTTRCESRDKPFRGANRVRRLFAMRIA